MQCMAALEQVLVGCIEFLKIVRTLEEVVVSVEFDYYRPTVWMIDMVVALGLLGIFVAFVVYMMIVGVAVVRSFVEVLLVLQGLVFLVAHNFVLVPSELYSSA